MANTDRESRLSLIAVLSATGAIFGLALIHSADPDKGFRIWQLSTLGGAFAGLLSLILGLIALRRIRVNQPNLGGAAWAYIGIICSILCCPAWFCAVVHRVKTHAPVLHSLNNLKLIALALQAYARDHGAFPPPAICDKAGKPLLSWRVLILPYLEYDSSIFHLDEPWDSPHNLAALQRQPVPVFSPPNSVRTHEPWMTHYQIIVGPGAAFEDHMQFKWEDFRDGQTNTLLVVEAPNPVPWTKPEDLRYAPDQPLPKMGGLFDFDFNVAFADGSVRRLKYELDPKTLRALITRNNGRDGPIDLD